MWPISQVFAEALRYSHVTTTTVDVYTVNNLGTVTRVLKDVPVTGGSISCSREQNVRRTLSCTVSLEWPNDGYTTLINSTNTRIQVWKGLDLVGATEKVPCGVFRVDAIDQTNRGELEITGQSLEILVIEDRFVSPYTPTYKAFGTAEISKLIKQSTNNATVLNRVTTDYKVQTRTPWARERWEAIDDMAEAMFADVYCAPDGTFVIEDQPSLERSPIKWIVDEGRRGVLVELTRTDNRDGVYNAVVASAQSTDPGVPPVSAVAYDLDPTSPTYWSGGFGHVPKFYESQFLYTTAQCTTVAKGQLAESRSLNKTLTFSAIPNPALEPGDAVSVALLDGTYEKHILQTFTIPLGHSGGWSATTLATKNASEPTAAGALSLNALDRDIAARGPRFEEPTRA